MVITKKDGGNKRRSFTYTNFRLKGKKRNLMTKGTIIRLVFVSILCDLDKESWFLCCVF